jgi:hypothetical protein
LLHALNDHASSLQHLHTHTTCSVSVIFFRAHDDMYAPTHTGTHTLAHDGAHKRVVIFNVDLWYLIGLHPLVAASYHFRCFRNNRCLHWQPQPLLLQALKR